MFGKDVWPDDFYSHSKGQKVSHSERIFLPEVGVKLFYANTMKIKETAL